MEALVVNTQSLSTNPGDLPNLHNILKQAHDSLHAESIRLLPLLEQLDPSVHSLGYLYILEACTSSALSKEQASAVVLPTARFMSLCKKEQILLAPEKFISVCKRFKVYVMQLEAPMRGVAPMLTAIRKIQRSSEHLTPLHPEFLVLCLLSKCYKAGLSILDEDILEVDQPKDLFLYCYYGGMICIGQKRFCKALELLHIVVTAPMSVITAIAVEAYKKYILVSLIHSGQFSPTLPKYTSSVAQRSLKNICQPYIELANSYTTGKIANIETVAQKHREKFDNDNNLGLVKQAISSMYKHSIQRLTQTHVALSLQDIANRAQLNSAKEAEMHVLQMIQDGELFATINQKDGIVSFLEDPEQYKSSAMIESIDLSIQRIMALSMKLTTMNENTSSDPMYLAKVGKEWQQFDLDDFNAKSAMKEAHENCTGEVPENCIGEAQENSTGIFSAGRPDVPSLSLSLSHQTKSDHRSQLMGSSVSSVVDVSPMERRLLPLAETVRDSLPEPSPSPGSTVNFEREDLGQIRGSAAGPDLMGSSVSSVVDVSPMERRLLPLAETVRDSLPEPSPSPGSTVNFEREDLGQIRGSAAGPDVLGSSMSSVVHVSPMDRRLLRLVQTIRDSPPEPSPFPGSTLYYRRDRLGRVRGLPTLIEDPDVARYILSLDRPTRVARRDSQVITCGDTEDEMEVDGQ